MAKKKPSDRLRNSEVKFMATASEKALYETVGAREADDMSKWIRAVLNAELKRLGDWKEKPVRD